MQSIGTCGRALDTPAIPVLAAVACLAEDEAMLARTPAVVTRLNRTASLSLQLVGPGHQHENQDEIRLKVVIDCPTLSGLASLIHVPRLLALASD